MLFEATGCPDIAMLQALEYPATPEVLERVRDVMKALPLGDFKLVDLNRNQGNCDAILIVTAPSSNQFLAILNF